MQIMFALIIYQFEMILLGRYELLKGYGDHQVSVGFGSYGQVKLAVDKKTGENVAVKIVKKLAKNQVVFHNQLYHPNVIQLLGHFIDREKQTTYMILQYADGGTLFDKLRTEMIPKAQIKNYFRDVCQAMVYLHQNQIMHRDIKPENILLTGQNKAKLCDFGFAAILGERKTLCGTYEYMSPQMIENRPYDYKIDIWALGILLFELISGKAPFRGNTPEQVINQMKTKIFFNERFSTQEINLIKMILRVTPHKRPTIKQILAHSYFNPEDSVSTKQSELQQNKINKTNLPEQKVNMYKPQQKSYPFYAPTTNTTNTMNSNLNYNPEQKNSGGFNTTVNIAKSPFGGKTKTGLNQNQIYSKQGMNTSFGNFSSVNYRNS